MENSEREGNTRPPDLPLEKSVSGQEATVITRHETMDWFKIGKGVFQGCIMSPFLFNLMQSTPSEKPGWMTHKLESILPGEVSITPDIQMIPL